MIFQYFEDVVHYCSVFFILKMVFIDSNYFEDVSSLFFNDFSLFSRCVSLFFVDFSMLLITCVSLIFWCF